MNDGSSTIHWPSNADFEFDGSHDDFAAYLNLDLSQFDTPTNGIPNGFEKQSFPVNGHGDAMDLDTFHIQQQQQQHHHHHHHHHVQQHHPQQHQQHDLNNHGVSDMDVLAFGDFSLQANQQQQHQQQAIQQIQGINSITPTNIGMRQNDQQAFRHHRNSMHSNRSLEFNNTTFRDDPSQFTPLVSPAVTPLETQFARMPEVPDFSMNTAYFSPLTSPALEAYPDSAYPDSTYSASSQASMRTSPVDVEPQARPSQPKKPSSANGSVSGSGSGSGRKKSVSKPSSSSSSSTTRPIRESPNLKPNHRKKSIPALIPTPELTSQLERMTTSSSSSVHRFSLGPPSDTLQPGYSSYNEGSGGSNSISPEPSSEMPPPPPPDKSRRNSLVRSMDPRKSSAPATPASLMKLANSDMPIETGPTGSVLEKADPAYLREIAAEPKTTSDDEQTTPTLASTRANGTTSANSNSSNNKKRPAPSSRKNSYDDEDIPHHEEEVPAKRKKTICQKEKDKNEEARKREKEQSPANGTGTGPSSKSGTPSSSRPVSMVATS
ncbi:hypothetical protein BJ508DRAFT_150495 [Ascobolus immersus RN42]|uniref:Uncharacterized protein n=1 Tax=Ascobolus immersus RN42 TaxID=1160509 RepID=A0A3N4HYV1_ASCIM|nr:hypothetical protein BJ508DRAFT_150495 [Ascobolus immersus RN42]